MLKKTSFCTTMTDFSFLAKNIAPEESREMVAGEGVFMYDANGKRYFDLSSQTVNMNLGHRHPVVLSVLKEFLKSKESYFLSSRWQSPAMAELAAKLVSIAPHGITKANVKLCNGSDALEDAFKRARRFHKRERKRMIVAQYRSHHGESCETLNASGKHFCAHSELGGSRDFLFVDPVHLYRRPFGMSEEEYSAACFRELASLIRKRDDVAAIVLELIQVTGGVLPQPKSFVKQVERLCREHNITFIVDEVQTAFGWTGTMFASEQYGIRPDIITLGKALTAGFPALGATLFRGRYDNLHYGESEFTNGGGPIACKVTLANIRYLETSGILNTIPEKSAYFMECLQNMKKKYAYIGDVRGNGLMLGIELVTDDGRENYALATNIYQQALNKGIILRKAACEGRGSNVLIIKSPLIITHDQIKQSMRILDRVIGACQ